MKMKYKGFSNLFMLIYANFWYIPLLAFLVGLKLCIVSFLVTCIQSGGGNEEMSESSKSQWGNVNRNSKLGTVDESYINTNHHHYQFLKGKRKSSFQNSHPVSSPTPIPTGIPKDVQEEWTLLANLKERMIRPSHSNRTAAESIWLIFNRIPRCGGSTLVKLLEKLGERNGFAHQPHEYRTPWPRFLLEEEQESLVTWFEYQHLPKSYDRHFFFVNFTKYQKYVKEKPIYINMMRDPVLRIQSDYLARRADENLAQLEIRRRDEEIVGTGLEWYERGFEDCVLNSDPECEFETGTQDFTLAVPFFCGQHNSCVTINDKWGLQMAKFTIERHYSVVGVLERMDQTLAVLENYIPKFFSGATQFFNQLDPVDQHLTRNSKNIEPLSVRVRETLEKKLAAEVELYRFINQRLALQFAHLAGTY